MRDADVCVWKKSYDLYPRLYLLDRCSETAHEALVMANTRTAFSEIRDSRFAIEYFGS